MRRQVVAAVALWAAGFTALPSAVAQVSGAIDLAADFSCGDTTPTLKFEGDDFRKGFRKPPYRFPGTERCELGVGGKRGGTITLTYCGPDPVTPLVPDDSSIAPLGPDDQRTEECELRAEIYYWEEIDCREHEDDPPKPSKGWFTWEGTLQPSDTDPEGIFPAASFGRASAKPQKMVFSGCTDGEPRDDTIFIRLVLVREDPDRKAIDRTPHLVMSGDFFGGAIVFGPVVEPPPGDVRLAVDGCAHISSGIDAVLTAYGEPAGGSYAWGATPSSVLSVDGDDATAIATAGSAGRGTVTIRYQDPEGREASSQIEGSVVELESVNQGQPLPKLGLLDANGKPTSKIVSVPIQMQPAGAGDLLDFKPDDPGIVTSQGDGVRLHLQPLREGTTVIQPRTVCGGAVGPALPVQVVPCDDEVLAQLEREEQAAKEAYQDVLRQIGEIRGSKRLQAAENETAEAAGDLLIKTGLLLVGALGAGKGADAAAAAGSSALGLTDALNNVMKDTLSGDALKATNSTAQLIVEYGGNAFQQLIVDAYEAVNAASRFGTLLGTLDGTSEQLESLARWQENYGRVREDIARRQILCKAEEEEPKPKKGGCEPNCGPKPDPKPTRVPHPPPKTIDVPSDEPPPATEPPVEEPPSTTIRVGLPYDKARCSCGTARELPANQQGLATLQEGITILDECVTAFREGALSPLAEAAKQGQELFALAANASKAGNDSWVSFATENKSRVEELRSRLQSFSKPAQEFTAEMETCAGEPAGIEFGMYSPEAASQQPPLLDVKRP